MPQRLQSASEGVALAPAAVLDECSNSSVQVVVERAGPGDAGPIRIALRVRARRASRSMALEYTLRRRPPSFSACRRAVGQILDDEIPSADASSNRRGTRTPIRSR